MTVKILIIAQTTNSINSIPAITPKY